MNLKFKTQLVRIEFQLYKQSTNLEILLNWILYNKKSPSCFCNWNVFKNYDALGCERPQNYNRGLSVLIYLLGCFDSRRSDITLKKFEKIKDQRSPLQNKFFLPEKRSFCHKYFAFFGFTVVSWFYFNKIH